MNTVKKTAFAFLLGVFAGGAVTYVGLHYYFHHWKTSFSWKMRHPEKIFKKLTGELSLNAEQQAEIKKILDVRLAELQELRRTVRPQFTAIIKSIEADIRAHLSPNQQIKFDQMIREIEKKREKIRKKHEKSLIRGD